MTVVEAAAAAVVLAVVLAAAAAAAAAVVVVVVLVVVPVPAAGVADFAASLAIASASEVMCSPDNISAAI